MAHQPWHYCLKPYCNYPVVVPHLQLSRIETSANY